MQVSVKVTADLERALGKSLAKSVRNRMRKGAHMKALPFQVSFCEEKPSFGVDDNGMLTCYAVNLATGEVLGERYCGSGDSTINYMGEQLGEGKVKMPEAHALFFVQTYWNGRNHSWTLTVVSKNLTKQLKGNAS